MKKITVFIIAFVLGAALVAASVYLYETRVNIKVKEPITMVSDGVALTISSSNNVFYEGYAGETFDRNITVSNAGTGKVHLLMGWDEDDSTNVTYNVFDKATLEHYPYSYVINPGQNNITVRFLIDGGSPVGILNGTLKYKRV